MLMCFSHENNFNFLILDISHRFLIMARLVTKYLTQFRQLGKNRSLELLESGHFNGTGKITMKKYILGCDTGIASDTPTRMLYYLSYQGYHKWRRKYKYLIWRKLGNLTPFGVAFVLVNALSKESKEVMLTRAAKYGNLKELKKLLSEGVDVNARHPLGWTALHVAVINGQSHIVQALLDAGADPDIGDEFTNPQKIALEKNMAYVDVCTLRYQEFSDKINYNATFEGFTALHYAVLMNNQDIVKSLLLAGANPTKKNSANFPPGDYCNKGPIKDLLISHIPKYGELLKKREAEERKRFPLEQRLKKFIVGQQGAIAVVSSAIRRKENGWTDDEHPLVFLFLGSSGVGKTELAKQVARYLHKDNPNAFIRLDMSEYQEKHEVAKLIGSPPGYIGHEDGGQLTKRLKKFPNAVVLFDEVDKAHPDVLTTLLQLFDEGRLTDGKGETIVCRDAIFVMTSNVASEEIAQHALELRREAEKLNSYRTGAQQKNKDDITETEQVTISRKFKDQVVRPVLKRHFKRDEFLGRINEFVYFLPFSKSELARLVTMELEFWAQKALKKHNIILTWNKDVTEALIGGYDVHYGARSIKYEIERRIISQLALGHEKGVVTPGSSIQIEAIWPKEDKNHEKSPVINLKVRQRGQRKFVNLDPYENIFKDTGFL